MSTPSQPDARNSNGNGNGNGTSQGTFQLAVLEKLEALQKTTDTVKADVEALKTDAETVKADVASTKAEVKTLVASDKAQNLRIARQGKLISKANAIKGTLAAVGGGIVLGIYKLVEHLGSAAH